MKKRVLAMLLVVAMTLGMTPTAFAAIDEAYGAKLIGTTGKIGTSDTVEGVVFTLQLKGTSIGSPESVVNIMLKVDTTKLYPVRISDGTELTPLVPGKLGDSMTEKIQGAVSQYCDGIEWDADEEMGFLSAKNIPYVYDSNTNILYMSLQPVMAKTITEWTDYTDTIRFAFKYVGDTTENSLDMTTVQLVSKEEAATLGQNAVAAIPGPDDPFQYAISSIGNGEENLAKPIIEYPGSDVMNLNGVKLDGANKFVNVPVSIPDAGDDVTVTTTATGYYTSDCADGTEITGDIAYTYGLQIKADGDTSARDLTGEEKAVISIDEDGVLTIKAGAPKAVVTIEATGSYTNTKNNVSTASGTYNVELCHGDAGEKKDNDPEPDNPPKPIGGDPDPEDKDALAGVIIYQKNGETQVQVAKSGDTVPYEYAVAVPKTEATVVEFTGKAVNAFGDEVTGASAAWSTTGFDTVTDPSFADGTMTVGTTATKGDYTLTYTADTLHADVKVTVDDTAIHWPTLSRNTMTYGETVSKLTINNDGSYVDSEGITHTEASLFSWDTPDATPDVATTKVVMKFDNGVEADAKTKDYDITVSKADLAIVLNSDAVIAEGDSIQLPQDNVITLADDIVLENTSVKDENGKNLVVTGITPKYTLSDEHSLVTRDPAAGDIINTITGTKISGNNEVATLGITANGGANYNDASRTLSIKVIKPVLNASIDFDTTTPVFREKITATITENKDQQNSIIADAGLTYQWGEIVIENGEEKFKALETGGAGVTGNLTNITAGNYAADPAVPAKATVEYTPVAGDVGKTLALQVITPSGDTSYGWIHSVQNKMAAPVARATWGTISGSVKSVTTTSVTVNGEKDAWFAIALKNAPVTAAEGETEEAGSDGHTWVKGYDDAGNAKDVEFKQDDAGNALKSNTEYTVFMKKEADGYETATTSFDTATAKESITPTPNPDPEKPDIPPTITGVTVTAAIDETAGLKYGQTLTASVTVDDTVPHDPVITIADDQWEYKWYRVTPAEGENPETEEVIKTEADVDYTGDSYTLTEADIDKVIRVKATTKDTCEYIAYANDDTSDKIAKADGPEFTNTLGADKASKADANDGAITGLTAGTEYEYIVKPVKAEGETEEPTPDWTTATKATADTDGKITGLGVNTYLVRIAGTTTHEPSAHKEIAIASLGYNITGVVVSYNAKNAVTYELFLKGEDGTYATTATYTGTAIEANAEGASGRQTQNFTIEGIADGTYKLVISKTSHLTYTVENVTVNGADLDLAAEAMPEKVKSMTMIPGDFDMNGAVNSSDLNRIANTANYNKSNASTARNPETDLDGNGAINSADKNLVTNVNHYNKRAADCVFSIS